MDSRTPPHLAKQPSFYTDTSPSPHTESSAPATPLSSRRHKGPHRDGFSVEKCRDVLVRQCSWIPRNYNFRDGVNQVYEVLREYLGDENLDLATAQLNELIEVPSQWPHDEGASFQSWKHDYMLRHRDLENSHVPRLRNIIVAPVNPTERLKKWREDHPDRGLAAMTISQSLQTVSGNGQIRPITPDYGIGTKARRGNWRLENALFVSSKTKGTQVLHCPSAQELHNKTWNEDFGRGGKLVQERIVNPGEPVDEIDHMPDQAISLKGEKPFADLRVMSSLIHVPIVHRIQSINFVPQKLDASLHRKLSTRSKGRHSKQASTRDERQARTCHHLPDPLLGRFASEVKIYEGDPTVRDLPDPESDTGKSYYSRILTRPLPPGICVPNPRFARKHNLVPEEIPLPGGVLIKLVPTADEVAIEKSFQEVIGSKISNHATGFAGPFTPELFKDSGIDFPQNWGLTQHVPASGVFETEALSDMGNSGDAAQSPSKHLQSLRYDIQGSSSFSDVTQFEENDLANASYSPSCDPLQIWSKNHQDFVPKVKQSNRRQWSNFTESFPQRITSNPIPVVESLCEPDLVLTHSLTDLTKTVQKFSSKSFRSGEMASSVSALLSNERHPLDILYSLGPYHSERPEIKPAMKSAIRESANSIQVSTIKMNNSCKATANEIETDEKNESLLLKEVPEITLNPPADDCKEFSTQACVQLKAENRAVLVAEINVFCSTLIEKNVSGKPTLELALDLLQETGDVCSETMLNCGSLGAERHMCVQNYQNNNKKKPEALSKREPNKLKTFTNDSPEDTTETSFTLIYNNKEPSKERIPRQKASEMDLNRDLPPLPPTNESQPLQFDDQSHQHSLESEADYTVEPLQPLYYDPVRDSLKYGGLHFHSDGMRYYPEIPQHPPRTSSMPRTCKTLETASGANNHQVTVIEYQKTSPVANLLAEDVFGTARASNVSYGSEGSSGIMGNFIPVKTVTSPSVTVTRAVHLPRIETDCSMRPTSQNSKHNATCGNASPQVLTCFKKDPEHSDSPKPKIFSTIETQQGSKGSIAPQGDHDSIDLNDPEALAKYIQHLKNIKNQPLGVQEQPLGTNSSLSQNLDGEAGRYLENKHVNNRTIIDCDEEAQNIQFSAQDYSEIRAGNPFEFDHDDVQSDPDRITKFTHFMGGTNRIYERSNVQPKQSGKMGHLKNSHSESNVFYPKKRPEPIQVVEHNTTSHHILQRSDSSPSLSPTRIAARYGVTQNSLQSLYEEDGRSNYEIINHSGYLNDLPRSPIAGHSLQISSPRRLDDVQENQETTFDTPPRSQKRPWSPVKTIFGEGGLLSITTNSKDVSTTPKKPGLVEKIKLKIEEIGLKADLNPIKYPFRSDHEKSPEQSTFPISLNPAQQAELYLDIELLICDSANTFLMNEYHNGRMSVDSLKKVTDFWKSKGRPQVVEFHYDQSTQRDLIVANQKTFRFYGPNANNPLKVHAMLYAWKTNAREMGIRTFCYPDSMIRKHIRDAFVILDFLGGHPFQYIAAHEVQKKLLRWISEGPVQVTTGISGPPSLQKVGRRPDESPTELVIDNPWYSTRKPIQRLNKQSSSSGNAQLTT